MRKFTKIEIGILRQVKFLQVYTRGKALQRLDLDALFDR